MKIMAQCGRNCKRYTLCGISTFLFVTGLLVAIFWTSLYYSLLKYELVIKKNSPNYDMWKETPIPIYFKIYLFNWTNSDAVLKNWNVKPKLEQCGPYTFSEHHIRVNMTWNDNGTITYQQKRIWHFLPEMSNGTLEDKITNVNVIAATAGYLLRYRPALIKLFANFFLKEKERSIVITKKVDELLYRGYDDELLQMITKLKIPNLNLPFDKFGWFYNRNGSETYDGIFTMNEGRSDISKLGIFEYWNGLPQSKFYKGACGRINGSSGELWPPVKDLKNVAVFSPDICSNINLKYKTTDFLHGIEGNMYVADDSIFDNGTKYPEQACFNTGDIVPSGVRNVSACRFGAPAFMSYPHFLYADEKYRQAVVGMEPDENLHGFSVLLEPNTGIPLNVSAGLQLNLYLQPISHLSFFSDIKPIFMPMVWFRQTAVLTSSYAKQVKVLLVLPEIIPYTGYGIVGISLILLASFLFITFHKGWTEKEEQRLLPPEATSEVTPSSTHGYLHTNLGIK